MKFLNLIVFLETNKTICAQPLRINICLKVVHDNLLVFVDNIVCLEIPDECAISRLTIRGNFDDVRASIDKRLKMWNEKTRPVASKYKAFIINAERNANDILQDLEKAIQ